jgi:hypothetical protein
MIMTYNKLLPGILAIAFSMPLSLTAQSTPQTSEQSTSQTPAQATPQTSAQPAPQSANGTQKPKKPATSPAELASNPQDLIPTLDLQFKAGDPVPGITASPAMVSPIQCNGDGAALLDMLVPPEFRDRALYLVSATKGTAISLKNIPELSNAQYMGAFASHSTVGALFYGTKKVEDSSKEEAYHNFIAEFDSENGYQRTIELPLTYVVKRFPRFQRRDQADDSVAGRDTGCDPNGEDRREGRSHALPRCGRHKRLQSIRNGTIHPVRRKSHLLGAGGKIRPRNWKRRKRAGSPD